MKIKKIFKKITLKFCQFYKIFILAPKSYKFLQKSQVLIYDRSGSEIFYDYLLSYKTEILSIRGEEINIWCLIRAIFSLDFWCGKPLEAYISQYIKASKPQVCITFIDNSTKFYNISCLFPHVKTILVQNGWRDNWLEGNSIGSYFVDHMLVFNEAIGSLYKKNINGELLAIGSFKNNHFRVINKNNNEDSILYISNYSVPKFDDNSLIVCANGHEVHWRDFFKPEPEILNIVKKWCENNNKKLKIAGCSIGSSDLEIQYYNNIFGDYNWYYMERKNIYSTYELLNSVKLIINLDSTIGYEALSRGIRVGFFSCRGSYIDRQDRGFGWPNIFPNKGLFWTNEKNDLDFNNILDYLNTVDDQEWDLVCKKYADKVMQYDHGNLRFKDLLEGLIR